MMEIQNSRTGALIQQARLEKNLTQKQLAERLHISDRTVSKWERGAGFPELSLLEPLGDALGLTVTELLHGQREPQEEDVPAAALSVQDAAAVLRKAWREKLQGLRKRVLLVCALLAAVAAVAFVGTIPSKPGGFSRQDSISVEQIFPGGWESSFSFPLNCRGTMVSPDHQSFETDLSPTELTDIIVSEAGADAEAAVWNLEGEEFRLFTVYPEDGRGRYVLLRCHTRTGKRELWRYGFVGNLQTAASLREEGENRRLLFPAFLLKTEGRPIYLEPGEAVPTRFPEDQLSRAFDAFRDFYAGPGAEEWYQLEADEERCTLTLTATDALPAAETRERVETSFQIVLSVRDGTVCVQADRNLDKSDGQQP